MNESERAKVRQAAQIQRQVPQKTPGENTFIKGNLTAFANGSAYFGLPYISSYQGTAIDSDLQFGTGDFTIEWWQKMESTTTKPHIFSIGTLANGTVGNANLGLSLSEEDNGAGSRKFLIYYNSYASWNSTQVGTYPTASLVNRWVHVAIVRYSGTLNVYVAGSSIGSVGAFTANLSDSRANTATFNGRNVLTIADMLAAASDAQRKYYGNITNFRVTKGVAVYTADFTPSTDPLLPLPNTTLLIPNIAPDAVNMDASKNARTIVSFNSVFSADSPMNPICGRSESLKCYLQSFI